MWSYAVSRLLQASIVIVAVTLITFLALQMSGDPTYLYVSDRASAEEIALVRERLGFDRPLHVQYLASWAASSAATPGARSPTACPPCRSSSSGCRRRSS
jgi:ABC-type dipeptide/oligopeptide/nickel transport system permease component